MNLETIALGNQPGTTNNGLRLLAKTGNPRNIVMFSSRPFFSDDYMSELTNLTIQPIDFFPCLDVSVLASPFLRDMVCHLNTGRLPPCLPQHIAQVRNSFRTRQYQPQAKKPPAQGIRSHTKQVKCRLLGLDRQNGAHHQGPPTKRLVDGEQDDADKEPNADPHHADKSPPSHSL